MNYYLDMLLWMGAIVALIMIGLALVVEAVDVTVRVMRAVIGRLNRK